MPMRRRLLAYESISSLAIESVGRVPRTALPACPGPALSPHWARPAHGHP